MRLPDAGWAQEDHILATLDEAQLVEAFDLLTPERGLKREVEVAELLDRGQATGAQEPTRRSGRRRN
jgi:hypothetical protein